MANRIQTNYDQLRSIAQTFEREAQTSQQLLQEIRRCVDQLAQGGWIGAGAEAFFGEMQDLIFPSITRLMNALQSSKQAAGQIAVVLRDAEEEAAKLFQGDGDGGVSGTAPQGGPTPVPKPTPEMTPTPTPTPPPPTPTPTPRPDIDQAFEDFKNNRQPYDNPEVGYPRDPVGRWLAEQAGLYRPDITELEANAMDKLSLLELNTFNNLHDEAFEVENQFFPNQDQDGDGTVQANNDGLGDAFRHAYWSARMTQEFGADWAEEFTSAHETKAGNPAARDFMDRHNNALGIRIAQEYPNASPEQLANLIAQAVQNGEGVYIVGTDQTHFGPPGAAENGPIAYTDQHPDVGTVPVDPNQIPDPNDNSISR
ncbi:MAG: WXG100 family type VII secretion target [Anaerolineae bacterium]|nr:WXG100 family type VII secretion target [Anaerolineae bacterium]